jgi:Zn-finger nucleic acid-binding protein
MVLYRERDYYYCPFCGSYHFPDENAEGLRILGENPDGLKCPLCHIPLNLVTLDDFYQGYTCSNCRGLLFHRTPFREVIESRRAETKAPPDPINTFNSAELERKINCPVCSKEMETFQYLGPGNIVIDTCHQDDLIWLDYGELQKVVNAPGRDRGVPRQKPLEEEKDKQGQGKKRRGPIEQAFLDLVTALIKSE